MDSTIKMVKRHLKKHGGRVHYRLSSKAAEIRPALLEIALAEFREAHPVSTFPTSDGGELAASYEGDKSGFSIVTSTYRHIESGHVVTDKRHVLSASVRYGGDLTLRLDDLRLDDTEASIVEFFASLVEAMRQRFPKAKLSDVISDVIEASRVDLGGGVHSRSIRREVQTVTPTGDAPSGDTKVDTPTGDDPRGKTSQDAPSSDADEPEAPQVYRGAAQQAASLGSIYDGLPVPKGDKWPKADWRAIFQHFTDQNTAPDLRMLTLILREKSGRQTLTYEYVKKKSGEYGRGELD